MTGGVDGGRPRRRLVVAGGDEVPARPALAKRAHREEDQEEADQAEVIDLGVGVQDARPEERGPVGLGGDEPGQVVGLQEVRRGGDSEGQGGHGQERPGHAQGREPDEQRYQGADEDPDRQRGEEVPPVAGVEDHRGGPADAGQPELPEGDLSRPSRQHQRESPTMA